MADKNYRTDEADIYEWWYLTYPFEQYRAIMQATTERYIRIDEGSRVENLGEAIYALECLKEKEIEHDKKNTRTLEEVLGEITKTAIVGKYFDETYFNREDLLKRLRNEGYNYLARDKDGDLWVFMVRPEKEDDFWDAKTDYHSVIIENDNFLEVQWSDEEPTKITDLLETYENGWRTKFMGWNSDE